MAVSVVILAAGQGTRMKSDLPKVLHTIGGRPMLSWVIDAVSASGPDRILVVVGYQADRVRSACAADGIEFVLQREQLGTGHAVMQCRNALDGMDGTVAVLNGDVPCLSTETYEAFVSFHCDEGAAATVLTAIMDDPTGYGRIIRDSSGGLLKIVEHKDATTGERRICEVNSGMFCFDSNRLFSALEKIGTQNAQNEYYLPDVVDLLRRSKLKVSALPVRDSAEVAGVNTVDELAEVRRRMGLGE